MYDTKRSREEFEDSFKFKDEKTGETSDSELSDFLDEINTDMMVFGEEQEMGFDENIGEAIRERLFSWSESPMISSESDEELKPRNACVLFSPWGDDEVIEETGDLFGLGRGVGGLNAHPSVVHAKSLCSFLFYPMASH